MQINNDYNEVCRLYRENGLEDYLLQNASDTKKIHGFDHKDTKGYEDLSEYNKQLFEKYLVNFMNSCGMNTKITMYPTYVHFVTETHYLRECGVDEETGSKVFEDFGRKVVINKLNGRTKQLKKFFYDEEHSEKDATKTTEEKYLRVEWKIGKKREWYHVIEPDNWY